MPWRKRRRARIRSPQLGRAPLAFYSDVGGELVGVGLSTRRPCTGIFRQLLRFLAVGETWRGTTFCFEDAAAVGFCRSEGGRTGLEVPAVATVVDGEPRYVPVGARGAAPTA